MADKDTQLSSKLMSPSSAVDRVADMRPTLMHALLSNVTSRYHTFDNAPSAYLKYPPRIGLFEGVVVAGLVGAVPEVVAGLVALGLA